ncbi:MAG TPA: M14 family zinc carboxypeptidase [Thermoguttaceae bacterium]|nr:M14 family zinc carboxypeptidase [Thermoguttaceae bacterium]
MRALRFASCLALLALAAVVQPSEAIVLSQDFDSGSLNVAASTISGNTVNLVGRKTWTQSGYSSYYRWVHFKASDVAGLQPQFKISSTQFLGNLSDHRYLYSYDQLQWNYFDQCYVSGSYYYFRNNQAFTGNEIYVAYSAPYPFKRTVRHVASVAASPFVCPTASGGGDLIIGCTSGGTDELGRSIAPNDLYGFKITDPSSSHAKVKILLAGGNHSCETPGNHALEGMIDFLLGDSPEAVGLRRRADFYVYPQVNPDGRVAGYYRSSVENPDKDYNRYWDNPTGFTDMSTVRNAMILDTGGDVDYLFDFHGMFGPWSRPPYFETRSSDANSAFALALAELEPGIEQSISSGTPGMLRIWGLTGLHAEHSFTPEFGCHPGTLEARLDEMGENYARALYRAIAPYWNWIPGDATGDNRVNEADAAVLAANWGQGGANWEMGDFNEDGLIGAADASILAANWGAIAETSPVAEPTAIALLATLAIIVFPRRR